MLEESNRAFLCHNESYFPRAGGHLPGPVYEFGDFRLDPESFELLRKGYSLRVERKPMELLILLATNRGRLLTRAEIAQRLWSSEVFVDTEHGINTAIRKLRHLLRDDPENPRFIQTVTGMGYRFVAPTVEVEAPVPEATQSGDSAVVLPDPPQAVPASETAHLAKLHSRLWIALAASVVVLMTILGASVGPHPLAARLLHRNTRPAVTSIAVLPLDNLSGDPSQEYFADGMTDELITMLAKDSTLLITSRTSVMQYKGVHRPLSEIARALKVDAVLEGSVSRSSNQVHMTLQLIRTDTDAHLWADSYDRNATDATALPSEAAEAIATRLKSAVPNVAAARYIDPEAHNAYLQGRYFWFGGNYSQCSAFMQKAIDLQPDYAVAWSGLSDCYGGASASGFIPPGEGFEKERAAAVRALELDNTLGEAHHSLAAYFLFHAWDWQRAEAESRRAIELNPNSAEFHHLYSYILRVQNRDQEAFEEQERATALDPIDRAWALGDAYIRRHQFDAAISEFEQRAASESQSFTLQLELAEAYWCKGMKKEWASHLEQAYLVIGDKASADAIQHAYATGGENAVGLWLLERDLKKGRTQYVSPLTLAFDYAQLGRKEGTLRTLESAYQERSPWLVFLQKEPLYDFLHADPRYRSLVRRIGLPPAY